MLKILATVFGLLPKIWEYFQNLKQEAELRDKIRLEELEAEIEAKKRADDVEEKAKNLTPDDIIRLTRLRHHQTQPSNTIVPVNTKAIPESAASATQ